MRVIKGDRVRLTKKGQRMFPRTPVTGVVISASEGSISIKVRPDGRKTASGWHRSFWRGMPRAKVMPFSYKARVLKQYPEAYIDQYEWSWTVYAQPGDPLGSGRSPKSAWADAAANALKRSVHSG